MYVLLLLPPAHANSQQLASIPHDVRKYSTEVADSLDRQVDHVATLVRDNLSHQTWLPSSVRPLPRTLPDSRAGSESFVDRIQAWALRNGAWSAAVVAFATTTGALYFGSKTLHGKRRKARRAISGARKEIVGMLVDWFGVDLLTLDSGRWITA